MVGLNNIILNYYLINELIFSIIYWYTSSRDFSNDKDRGTNRCLKYTHINIFTAIVGIYYAKMQGIQTMKTGNANFIKIKYQFMKSWPVLRLQ